MSNYFQKTELDNNQSTHCEVSEVAETKVPTNAFDAYLISSKANTVATIRMDHWLTVLFDRVKFTIIIEFSSINRNAISEYVYIRDVIAEQMFHFTEILTQTRKGYMLDSCETEKGSGRRICHLCESIKDIRVYSTETLDIVKA